MDSDLLTFHKQTINPTNVGKRNNNMTNQNNNEGTKMAIEINQDNVEQAIIRELTIKTTAKTKTSKHDVEPKQTEITVEFNGATLNQIIEYALKPIVIAQQRVYREAKQIPTSDTIQFVELIKPKREAKQINVDKLTNEQAQALLEQLMAKLG